MTDNRTTELREKLDALCIEHTDASYKRNVPITAWTVDDATFCYVEGFESTDLHIDNATPEQAIAATLGAPINEVTGKPFDFSKLASRLNDDKAAEQRKRTCELTYGENDAGIDGWYTECGEWFEAAFHNGRLMHPSACYHCGRKAVER